MRSRLRKPSDRRWGKALGAVLFVLVGLTMGAILTFSPEKPTQPVQLTTAEWAPYVSKSLEGGGPVVQMVSDVMRSAGFDPDVSFTSWAMTEPSVDGGTSLALFPVIASEHREEKYLVSDPILEFEYVLFHRTSLDADEVRGPDDLRHLRVGFISGYDYWPEIESAVGDEKYEFDDASAAFSALSDGEVDIVAEGLNSGRATLNSVDFDGDASTITYIDRDDSLVRSREHLRLVMRRSDATTELMGRFNDALATYRDSGQHAAVLATLDQPPMTLATLRPDTGPASVQIGAAQHVTPSGTRVKVLDWPSRTDRATARARVKVLNGPLTGRVGRALVSQLELDGPETTR